MTELHSSILARKVASVARSRIPVLQTPHTVSVVRKVDRETKQHGRIVKRATLQPLYNRISGRITELREFVENVTAPLNFGNTSAHVYRALLDFRSIPHLLRRADLICIPWGTKPNYWCPDGIPFSPSLVFGTPDGPVVLDWNGSTYEGGGFIFQDVDGEWCLTGPDVDFCFDSEFNPLCQEFPEGFNFIQEAGPVRYYEVLRFENMLDHLGLYHHTRIEMELTDTDKGRGQ